MAAAGTPVKGGGALAEPSLNINSGDATFNCIGCLGCIPNGGALWWDIPVGATEALEALAVGSGALAAANELVVKGGRG